MGAKRALYRASLRIRISSMGLVAMNPTRRSARMQPTCPRTTCLVNFTPGSMFH